MTQQDNEFRANAEAKEKLLVEAEALLPGGALIHQRRQFPIEIFPDMQ